MDIEQAKRILIENGYAVIKITDTMEEKMDKCVSGEDDECLSCCACVCILNQ